MVSIAMQANCMFSLTLSTNEKGGPHSGHYKETHGKWVHTQMS